MVVSTRTLSKHRAQTDSPLMLVIFPYLPVHLIRARRRFDQYREQDMK